MDVLRSKVQSSFGTPTTIWTTMYHNYVHLNETIRKVRFAYGSNVQPITSLHRLLVNELLHFNSMLSKQTLTKNYKSDKDYKTLSTHYKRARFAWIKETQEIIVFFVYST